MLRQLFFFFGLAHSSAGERRSRMVVFTCAVCCKAMRGIGDPFPRGIDWDRIRCLSPRTRSLIFAAEACPGANAVAAHAVRVRLSLDGPERHGRRIRGNAAGAECGRQVLRISHAPRANGDGHSDGHLPHWVEWVATFSYDRSVISVGRGDYLVPVCIALRRRADERMMFMAPVSRASKFASALLLLVAAAAMAGCANTQNDPSSQLGPDGKGPVTPGTQRDFSVNVGDLVYFSSDSSDLTPEAQSILQKQSQWLRQYPQFTITVEGHADERGTREYNIALGARRATTVRNYLAQNGVAANRIRTISYGKERPVAVCNDISCWSQNRRAQTVLNNRVAS